MDDWSKTKEQLLKELEQARQQLASVRHDIAERKLVEEALDRERQLLKETLDLQERERRLVAYEIHDGLTQDVTAALLHFQAFGQLRNQPEEAEEAFRKGVALLRQSIDEARRLINGLRPPLLDEAGVVAAITGLVEERRKLADRQIDFVHDVRSPRLSPPLESAVFRIVQEALTNALRHSHSEKVCINLVERGGQLRLEVQDWGGGFDPGKVPNDRFGLQGIRERARILGGQATIDSLPGRGTRIIVELPTVQPPAGG